MSSADVVVGIIAPYVRKTAGIASPVISAITIATITASQYQE